jgi:Flp pilus assembly protein TadD
VGSFNALVSLPERPDHWMPQVISISALRSFLRDAGVDPATLDTGLVPTEKRPADARIAFGHLIRITAAAFADDWTRAEQEARALVRQRPDSAEAHRILGTTLAGAGRNVDALRALDESKRLAPDAVPTLHQRALTLRALERIPEAEADLRRAVELDPEDHESWLQLGRTLADLDRLVDARDALRRAVRAAPNHPLAHWDLGLVLRRMGEVQAGLAACKIAVDMTVDTEPLRPLRVPYARMLAQAGQPAEAEKELREAIRLDPGDAGAHLALASFLAELDRKEEARKEAEKALTLKPEEDVRQAAAALLKSLGPMEG